MGLVASLGGCYWASPGNGADRRSHNAIENGFAPDTVDGFEQLWSTQTDEVGPRGVGHPVTSDAGFVHVSSSRTVYNIDPATGDVEWSHTAESGRTFDTDLFTFDETNLVVSSYQTPIGADIVVQWGIDNGHFIEPDVSGRVDAFRPDTFTSVFSRFTTTEHRFSFFPGITNVLVSNQPDRSSRLTLGAEQIFHAGVGVGTAPANGVRSWAVDGFGLLRSTPLDGTRSTAPVLSADQSTAYVGTDAGTLYAVDTSTGAIMWSGAVGAAVSAPPALADGQLYVPTAAGSLVVLDAAGCGSPTCAPNWTTAAGSSLDVQPAVGGGVVFVGDAGGSVRAYDADGCGAAECPALWDEATGSTITGAPAISLGRVFVGTQDGRLIAFGLPA